MKPETLSLIPTFRKKMAYIPFKGGVGGARIGVEPLPKGKPWFELDEDFEVQMDLKAQLLKDGNTCYKATKESAPAREEAVGTIADSLYLSHRLRGFWSIGFYVQDDLCIMEKISGEWRLTAASVCFPSSWSLEQMFNKTSKEIHGAIGTDAFRIVLDKKMDEIGEEVMWRTNWFLYDTPDLRHDYPNKLYDKDWVTPTNVGSRLFIRYERQTLRRLPKTGAVLFTIRVYVDPLRILKEEHSEHIPDFIKAYKKHKIQGPWCDPMFKYLEE